MKRKSYISKMIMVLMGIVIVTIFSSSNIYNLYVCVYECIYKHS